MTVLLGRLSTRVGRGYGSWPVGWDDTNRPKPGTVNLNSPYRGASTTPFAINDRRAALRRVVSTPSLRATSALVTVSPWCAAMARRNRLSAADAACQRGWNIDSNSPQTACSAILTCSNAIRSPPTGLAAPYVASPMTCNDWGYPSPRATAQSRASPRP